jgi:hypothetical protein
MHKSIMSLRRAAAIAAVLVLLSGCATLTESDQQRVTVHTIEGAYQVFGAVCTLANPAGQWQVTTPGSVILQKSPAPLRVDCRKEGASPASATVASHANATVWSNLVLTVGVGYLVDRRTGAGFDYPDLLNVVMRSGGAEAAPPPDVAGSVIF